MLVLAGVLALLVGYYWVHKPLGLGLLQVWGGAALDVLTVALVIVTAGGVGRRVLARLVEGAALPGAERVALEAGIGLGLLSLAVLVIGLLGLLQPPALWLLLAAALLANPLGWLRDARALAGGLHADTAWEKCLALFVVVLLVLALLHALAPPTAWDGLMYHLVAPKVYLAQGAINAAPQNHYLGFQQGVETLFTLVIGLFGRDTAAGLLHFAFGLLMLLAACGLVRRYADRASAWVSAALLLSSTSLWLLFGWPYVDLAVMAYALLALVALNQWRETQQTRWLLVVGVCLGLLVGVKYPAGMMALAVAAYLLYAAPRQFARHLLLVGVAALVIFLPWLVKGWLLYHNPVYPFVFGGLNWDMARSVHFSQTSSGLLRGDSPWQLVVLPVAATIFGVEKALGYGFTLGPWLLTAPLLALVGWRWLPPEQTRPFTRLVLVLLGALLLQWMALAAVSNIGMGPRQTGAVFMAVAAVAGGLGFYALSRWPRKPFDLNFIVRGIVAFTLALMLIESVQTTLRAGQVAYFAALAGRDRYLDSQLGAHINAMRQLATLPAGSRVRFLWEPRAYYCPAAITCDGDVLTDFWAHPLAQGQTPEAVMAGWQAGGDDYLLVWETGLDFALTPEAYAPYIPFNEMFPAARERWLEEVWTDGVAYRLYRWRES